MKSNQRTLSTFVLKINFFFIVLQVYKSPGGLGQTQLQIHVPAKNELWAVFYEICTELESTDPAETNGSKFVEKCQVQCQHAFMTDGCILLKIKFRSSPGVLLGITVF